MGDSSYVPVPEELRAAARLFLTELDRYRVGGLSQREFARQGRLSPRNVQRIYAYEVGLPPAKLRLLLEDDPATGEAAVCRAYLTAYGSLYPGDALKWIRDRADQAGVPQRPEAVSVLERATHAAMREANRLVDTRSMELFLQDLYVPRRFAGSRDVRSEADLEARCGTASVTVIVGEPGTGKTSALWRLTGGLRRQTGRSVWLVAAGALETEVPIADIAWALRVAPRDAGPPVLLVDTVDLLLRSDEFPPVLDEVIRACSAAGAALVMTCRPREYELLRRYAEQYEVEKVQLGPYSDGELPAAVEKHAKHFIDRRFDPFAIAQAVLTAVARGLPIAQICQVPLTLRMLFELHQLEHTGDQPVETEIDVTDLFDKYWQLRVRTDARTNRTGSGPDDDLSIAAEMLAVVMLAAGTPRVDSAGTRALERVEGLLDDLATLVRRSVVHEVGDGLREFFHQTFFEYAVARAIVALGATALDALVTRTLVRPDDAFLGAVTQQALVYACRTAYDAAVVDQAFATLLNCTDSGVQQVAIAAYAQARHRGPLTATAGHRLLASAGKGLARRYLIFVSRVRHDDLGAVLEDLALAWEHDDAHVRAEVFGAFRSLAVIRRDPILDAVTAEDAPHLSWYLRLDPHAAQRRRKPVLDLLGELAPADPGWCADRLEEMARAATRDDGAQDGVAAMLAVAAECRLPADRLRRLLAVIPSEVRTDPSGANELGLVVAGIIRQIWAAEDADPVAVAGDLAAGVSSYASLGPGQGWAPPSWLSGPARLRALADLACDQEPAVADRLITILLSATEPMARTHIGNYFLKHLLGGGHRPRLPGGAEPAETPATKVARKRCAERLRTPAAAPGKGRSDKALWREALYAGTLPPAEVATIVAEVIRGEVDPGWLDVDQLAALLVPAALGDVAGARNALTRWSHRSAPRAGEGQLRRIVMPRLEHLAADFPEAFDHLIGDALATTDGRYLDGAITKIVHKRLTLPADFAERVAPVVHALLASSVPGTVRDGFAIAARVGHGRMVGSKTLGAALKIRDKGALTAVLNLVGAGLDQDAERWADPDEFARLDDALEALEQPDAAPNPTLGRRAYEYRRTLYCHSAPIGTVVERRATLERVRELVLEPGDPMLLEPLGRLLSRLAKVDVDAAAALLVDTAATIERIAVADSTNSWKSRRAFRLRHAIRNVLVALPYGAWKRTIAALAEQDVHVFTSAIDISIRERSDEAAAHLRKLVDTLHLRDDRVEAMLRTATTRRQRVTGGISTWAELLDLYRAGRES
ncbi:NACHT domain-containing protein [Actinoplanes regularis]|uniref:NACHT domain-containing protein n=1 Tax=Actinoplanes regularis TaxID=52697 RepID=UPI000B77129B|nr:hypothetical protein [Actinoplanes regularis]GIE88128.1 hypothetical protein Are01nite_46080 [Actinoplanes regularis]